MKLILAYIGLCAALCVLAWFWLGESLRRASHDNHVEVRDRRRAWVERRLGLQPPPLPERRNKNRRQR